MSLDKNPDTLKIDELYLQDRSKVTTLARHVVRFLQYDTVDCIECVIHILNAIGVRQAIQDANEDSNLVLRLNEFAKEALDEIRLSGGKTEAERRAIYRKLSERWEAQNAEYPENKK